jgi:DNA/RNA-binding domain of Phe-tRNA-synthetase-like protein
VIVLVQTFNLYNATTFPEEALRLRLQKHLPMPSDNIFADALNYTNTNTLPPPP